MWHSHRLGERRGLLWGGGKVRQGRSVGMLNNAERRGGPEGRLTDGRGM